MLLDEFFFFFYRISLCKYVDRGDSFVSIY